VLGDRLVWQPAGAREPLAIALPALFARVHGERR